MAEVSMKVAVSQWQCMPYPPPMAPALVKWGTPPWLRAFNWCPMNPWKALRLKEISVSGLLVLACRRCLTVIAASPSAAALNVSLYPLEPSRTKKTPEEDAIAHRIRNIVLR